MIFINELDVMQDGFRLAKPQLCDMVNFVAQGGRFNHESLLQHNPQRTSLVAVVEFEDGRRFIRDGFHRAAVILFARDVPCIFDDEYVIENMTYDMYLEPNIENQWYTPFDPRIEVRRSDFFNFKDEVLSRIDQDGVIDFIKQNKDRYAIPRNSSHKLVTHAEKLWPIWNQDHADHQVNARQ